MRSRELQLRRIAQLGVNLRRRELQLTQGPLSAEPDKAKLKYTHTHTYVATLY